MDQGQIIVSLSKYYTLLSKHFEIERMLLYGSYANNNARKDSDIDVAVIVRKRTGDYFEENRLLWELRVEIDTRIEPMLFESGKDASGFLAYILKTGIEIQA